MKLFVAVTCALMVTSVLSAHNFNRYKIKKRVTEIEDSSNYGGKELMDDFDFNPAENQSTEIESKAPKKTKTRKTKSEPKRSKEGIYHFSKIRHGILDPSGLRDSGITDLNFGGTHFVPQSQFSLKHSRRQAPYSLYNKHHKYEHNKDPGEADEQQDHETAEDGHNVYREKHNGGKTHLKTVTITKEVAVPIPKPYPVPLIKRVPVPVAKPIPIAVDKPYPVYVPYKVLVPIIKHIPVPVEKPVPYRVQVPVRVPVHQPVPVHVPKPIPYTVHVPIKVPVPQHYPVTRPVVVETQNHHDEDKEDDSH